MANALLQIEDVLVSDLPVAQVEQGLVVESETAELSECVFRFRPTRIIFPTREGEYIEDLGQISIGSEYSLTYPGTASMKCVVIFQEEGNVFVGGEPSYEYTRITLKRESKDTFCLTFLTTKHHYFITSFDDDWTHGADRYKTYFRISACGKTHQNPRYVLQLGVKDPFGQVHIRHFSELYPVVELFQKHFGTGNIIHFFGTNTAGFDRMFPDYTIDPSLGGEPAFREMLHAANALGLSTSHHYNPRIADSNWIERHPEYVPAIVRTNDGEVRELYKDHFHFVMNPNHDGWFGKCFETVEYLHSLGLDYLEIDQFTYQRNFYNPERALALGYKKMVDELISRGIKFWLEGVSDVFRLPPGNFCQILIRDKAQLWGDNENRRGYPYGRTFASFFMYLYPDSEVSYQILTEHKLFDKVRERFDAAKANNAAVYDIELGFYDEHYVENLKKVISILEEHGAL